MNGHPIEHSLFSFIWKYSKGEQLRLLVVTCLLFPLLYLTLVLPKRIINDAIGAEQSTVAFWGFEMGQVAFLTLLCCVFLLSVFTYGIVKMRINTLKGVMSERLLRRLRFTLISRILRFPSPYFERTSQGELVSMVTSEAEPMGGFMGDAVAQPILQAGQMLTILGFLFYESLAFGAAACALIPLQAWLIPKLQRQINLLNKERVIEVRALAAEIGESAAGAATLRTNGGWRFRLAMISDRLGRLYGVRFRIYQKKFFMKFLNNFIGQLTPFFFYMFGGYLVIRGEVTVGALVAALAAYKELASPWKNLLVYYNQSQDMALRWDTIVERFAPHGMVDATLFDGTPAENPRLNGDITLREITVLDAEGTTVLHDLNAVLPKASLIAIEAASQSDRRAMADLLTRELLPASGEVQIAGHTLSKLHQTTISSRIGYVTSRPMLFQGQLGVNINMGLRTGPQELRQDPAQRTESERTGNSTDPVDVPWLQIAAAGVDTEEDLQHWWIKMIGVLELGEPLFCRAVEQKLDTALHPELAAALVRMRPQIARVVQEAGLSHHVSVFDKKNYNPSLPVAENLLFASPVKPISAQVLLDHPDFMTLLRKLGLERDLLKLAVEIVGVLNDIFGVDGTEHPLFQKLGLEINTYEEALTLVPAHQRGDVLSAAEKACLLAVPFVIPANKIGTSFPIGIIHRVLNMRIDHADALRKTTQDIFTPLDYDAPIDGLSVLENVLFGKLNDGADTDALITLVGKHLQEAGLEAALLRQLLDLPVALGGSNLPATLVEPLALFRAMIKRPDILVLDMPLASFGADLRDNLATRIATLLPETTVVSLGPDCARPDQYDHHFVMRQGRLSMAASGVNDSGRQTVNADQAGKLQALEAAKLFAGLEPKQLKLLAFGARWYTAQEGDHVFRKGDDPSTGAFLVLEGTADLLLPEDGEAGEGKTVATVAKGDLVGELGFIRGVPRALDMRATSELKCLRIGKDEFMAVVENDAATAFKLLQVVAGYVSS